MRIKWIIVLRPRWISMRSVIDHQRAEGAGAALFPHPA